MLQQTVDRLEGLVPRKNILIVSNKQYKDQILDQINWMDENQLLLEPSRNNTAPCVAFTALHLKAIDPEAVFAMIPADHVIQDEDTFRYAMNKGFDKANGDNSIVTLGIQPSRPDTGYGYIHFQAEHDNGVHKVNSFKEKPSRILAQQYLEEGGYVWNAGIFIWSCKTILSAFANSSQQILKVLTQDESMFGTAGEQAYVDKVYPSTESISVDYAILESAKNVYTIPVDMGWSDLGTWNSLYSFMDKDEDDNVMLTNHHELIESKRNLVRLNREDKLLVVKGLSDYIIIDEDDVLLIYPRDEEQEIKSLRASLKDKRFE